jgi:hypothetical protein
VAGHLAALRDSCTRVTYIATRSLDRCDARVGGSRLVAVHKQQQPPSTQTLQVESSAFTVYFTGACGTGLSCLYRIANALTAAVDSHTLLYTSASNRAYLGLELVPAPLDPLVQGNLLLTNVQTTVAAQTAATAVQFVQMNTSGAVLQTYAVPSASGSSPCTLSGSPSEGRLAASVDGSYFTFACYAAAAGTGSISGSTTTTAARAFVSLGLDATVQATDAISTTLFSGNPVFSAVIYDASGSAYVVGQTSTNGWDAFNVGTGAGTTSVISSQGNGNDMFKVLIYGGSMYIAYNSRNVGLVGTAGTLPTGSVSATALGSVVGSGSDALYSFVFQNATWLWGCVYGGTSGQGVSRYILTSAASAGGTFTNPYLTAGSWQWSAGDCMDITGQIEPSGSYFLYWVAPGTLSNTAVYRMATTAGAAAVNIATSANQYRGIVVIGAYVPVSATATQSQSISQTQTRTASQARSPSQTLTTSQTQSRTPSQTQTASQSQTRTSSQALTASQTASQMPSASRTPSQSPTVQLGGYIIGTQWGVCGVSGHSNAGPTTSLFNRTASVAFLLGSVYISDRHTIRRSFGAVISLAAGVGGTAGAFSGDGGPVTSARFNVPTYMAANTTRSMFWISDCECHAL